ncbi:MAG TPA: hypothetical protein VF179_20340, partial [Thermoanaerobaculia bacterium]|nr:hypothetical protein [Thermoanaerobaculia bacterium]
PDNEVSVKTTFKLPDPVPSSISSQVKVASQVGDATSEVEVVNCPEPEPEPISLLCTGITGIFVEGATITCTFEMTNHGPAVQMDNPGDEFTNILPAGLTLVTAAASSGTISTPGNTVIWNGGIEVEETVTVTFDATIDVGTAGSTLCIQAKGSFDLDGTGTNETELLSDYPGVPGDADPCCFFVSPILGPVIIPTLSDLAAVALALLLAALSLGRLRRPSAGR